MSITSEQGMYSSRMRIAELRSEHRRHKEIMAQREARVQVNGKNAEERKNALLIALAADDTYCESYQACEDITLDIDRYEAEIEYAKDQRREREWAIRLRLVEALERRGLEDDGRDGAFDEVADQLAWNANMNGARPKTDDEIEIPF